MKKRVILSALVCFVCMASLVGCGGKKTYKMGEKMEFDEDEGEYTVMITDWGTSLGESLKNILKGKKVTYFEYEVENTGDDTVVIDAEKIFSVYADNYNASMKWPDDSARQKTLTPGRKMTETIYAELDKDEAKKVEVQVNEDVVVMKDVESESAKESSTKAPTEEPEATEEPEETNEVQITPEPDQEPDTFATTEPTTEYDQIATATPDTADDQLEFSPAAGNDSSGQTTEEPEETDKEEGYILPDSSVKKLTKKDVKGLSKDQCRYARNEIYARHGRKFTDKKLQDYFDNQSWYEGTVEPEDFDESVLSKVEKKNIKLLKKYENK